MQRYQKFVGLLLLLFLVCNNFLQITAESDNLHSRGRTVVVFLSRLNLTDFRSLPSITQSPTGYVGLMNVRGTAFSDDASSYASMASGRKVSVRKEDLQFYEKSNEYQTGQFRYLSGKEPLEINNIAIHSLMLQTQNNPYDASVGILGERVQQAGRKIYVLGNSNHEEKLSFAALAAMDTYGRVQGGDIDRVIRHNEMSPYGQQTDYERMLAVFKEQYPKQDILFLEVGDSYRLDEFAPRMAPSVYQKEKEAMLKRIDFLIEGIKMQLSPKDCLLVVSPFPNQADYQAGYRLAPIYLDDFSGKGILTSASTRREGIVSNIDFADFLNQRYRLNMNNISGKSFQMKQREDGWAFLKEDYEKVVSLSRFRIPVLYSFAIFEMCSWMIGFMLVFWKREKNRRILDAMLLILRISLVIPFVILVMPAIGFKSVSNSLIIGGVLSLATHFVLSRLLKNDFDKFLLLAGLTSLILLIDMGFGNQFLIKNSLLGYDPIIGARFYGIGNEYMGVLVGSLILSLSICFQRWKYSNVFLIATSVMAVFFMGNPTMGANVGGTITMAATCLILMLKSNHIRFNFKSVLAILLCVAGAVALMAWMDMNSLNKTHLASTIIHIRESGFFTIGKIIMRKLSMNMKLISASIWSKVLILALVMIAIFFVKPILFIENVLDRYPSLKNGWTAIIAGSIVGFAVNDSGVVAAATAIGYVIVPLLVVLLTESQEQTV